MESMYMENGVRNALSDILHELEYGKKEEATRLVRELLNDQQEVEEA